MSVICAERDALWNNYRWCAPCVCLGCNIDEDRAIAIAMQRCVTNCAVYIMCIRTWVFMPNCYLWINFFMILVMNTRHVFVRHSQPVTVNGLSIDRHIELEQHTALYVQTVCGDASTIISARWARHTTTNRMVVSENSNWWSHYTTRTHRHKHTLAVIK